MSPAPLDRALIRSLLSAEFGADINVAAVEALGRGNVWRVALEGAPPPYQSVVAKRDGRDPAGYFDDVAGLRLLSDLGRSPKLLGSSQDPRLMVMEDLAGPSVADFLLAGDAAAATAAVLGLAATLGTIHASMMGRVADYDAVRQALGPARERILRHRPSSLPTLVRRLEDAGIAEPSRLRQDFATVEDLMIDPGPFRTYIHGDPCPDNTVVTDAVRLFDFEWGGIGHALLDGCYLEVPFPTCWCYGRLPETVVRDCEDLYRRTLAEHCPAAGEDSAWHMNLTAASASWWLAGLDEFLAPAFDHDEQWGTASVRQRVIHRTSRFAALSRRTRVLTSLGEAAEGLHATWSTWWDDVGDVPAYPAFA